MGKYRKIQTELIGMRYNNANEIYCKPVHEVSIFLIKKLISARGFYLFLIHQLLYPRFLLPAFLNGLSSSTLQVSARSSEIQQVRDLPVTLSVRVQLHDCRWHLR